MTSAATAQHLAAARRPWILRLGRFDHGRDVAAYDPEAIAETYAHVRALGRCLPLFPAELSGVDRLPPPPALIVMNHSGGDTALDAWGFMYAWYRNFGARRPLRPLGHQMLLEQPLTGPYLARRGMLAADREVTRRALVEARHDVLVMPGGDLEAWRPYHQRHRVDFAGRRGYATLAISAGVPIVPVGHVGAHSTLVVLARGERLARALRLHLIARADIFPLHLSLPWGLGVGPLPHLPWPARLRFGIAEPIAVPRSDAPSREAECALDRRVRAAVQGEVDRLVHPS